jgi:predicted protein tyrosine phosphatase
MSTMNRLANVTNQFQTRAKKVLCVCSAGLLRSPTTAKVLAENFGYNTRAAGINNEYALIRVDEVLIAWSDEIVFMEQEHLNEFELRFPEIELGVVVESQVLGIPDHFRWSDPELIEMILAAYKN